MNKPKETVTIMIPKKILLTETIFLNLGYKITSIENIISEIVAAKLFVL